MRIPLIEANPKSFLIAFVFWLLLLVAHSCFADANDDIGWFGDVGLGTGCAYRLTNHWDCDEDHLDPFPALVFGLSLDYFGQKLSRNEDPFDNRHMSQAEGEQILVGFESTILTTGICFLFDELDRQDAKGRSK